MITLQHNSKIKVPWNPDNPWRNKVVLLGHRGYSSRYPECTLLAMRETYKAGIIGAELDCRITKDGEVAVIHDPTVNRTTAFSGDVSDYDLSELMAMDTAIGTEFEGRDDVKIPSADQVLDEIEGTNFILDLDIKDSEAISVLFDKVKARGMEKNCFFTSHGNTPALEPIVGEGVLTFPSNANISEALEYGISGVTTTDHSFSTYQAAHSEGLLCRQFVSVANTSQEFVKRHFKNNVNIQMTDFCQDHFTYAKQMGLEQINASDIEDYIKITNI